MSSKTPTIRIFYPSKWYRDKASKFIPLHGMEDTECVEFIHAVCALANSEGGRIILYAKENEGYSESELIVITRMLERRALETFGYSTANKMVRQEKGLGDLETSELIFSVQAWPSSLQPCTVKYNLYLATESQVKLVDSSEMVRSVIKDIVEKKPNPNGVFEFGSHHRSFPIGEAIPLRESKNTQFRYFRDGKTKIHLSLVTRMHLGELTSYVSAFANGEGGHIYYGIKDPKDGSNVVVGQVVKNEDNIICRVEKIIQMMLWPKDYGEPTRGKHWQIFFEHVSGIHKECEFKFVIVIAIAPSLQPVFTMEPESYHVVNGKIERLSYTKWEKRLRQHIISDRSSIDIPPRTEEARQIHGFLLNWTPVSEIHRVKYEKLLTFCGANPEKIKKLDGVRVCCKKEFMIGIGCDGTRVYIGLSNDGYERAVKRLLKDVCEHLGLHEKKILNAVDSKFIVRYWFYDDNSDDDHVYLILDLCEETLEEYVEGKCLEVLTKDAPVIMRQILQGLHDLHRKPKPILHRDLKPSNIMRDVHYKWLLTDFGISRTLSYGQTTHRSDQRGTDFWRAVESYPETNNDKPGNKSTKSDDGSTKSANDRTKSDDDNTKSDDDSTKSDDDSTKSANDRTKSANDSTKSANDSRYKRQSDIQVAGMMCFYILTKGDHPFGPAADRVRNLLDDRPVGLVNLTDPVAKDFISWMLQHNPEDRPYAHEALKHPYLQPPEKQFELLDHVGNQREIKKRDVNSDLCMKLNNDPQLSRSTWKSLIPPLVLAYLCSDGKNNRSYGDEWTECLRLIRNKSQHWNDLPCPRPEVHYEVGEPKDYFLVMFPTLPVVVHRVIRSKENWKERAELKQFF